MHKYLWIQTQVRLPLKPILLTTMPPCLSALGLFLKNKCFQRRDMRGSIITVICQIILTLCPVLRCSCFPIPPALVLCFPSPLSPFLLSASFLQNPQWQVKWEARSWAMTLDKSTFFPSPAQAQEKKSPRGCLFPWIRVIQHLHLHGLIWCMGNCIN